MSKHHLYHDALHNQLRLAQGIPAAIPALPLATSTLEEVMQINTDTLFHVSSQSGEKEGVHLLASSDVDVTVYVQVVPMAQITTNGTRSRSVEWPATSKSIRVHVPAFAPCPTVLLQGHVIRGGAAISLLADVAGARAFGFYVSA